jgi:hypothetical protein
MASKWGEVGLESGSSPTWSRVKRDKQYSVTRVLMLLHTCKKQSGHLKFQQNGYRHQPSVVQILKMVSLNSSSIRLRQRADTTKLAKGSST